jgi:hypothetical protein
MDAGMQMPPLVSSMPMPSYGQMRLFVKWDAGSEFFFK